MDDSGRRALARSRIYIQSDAVASWLPSSYDAHGRRIVRHWDEEDGPFRDG